MHSTLGLGNDCMNVQRHLPDMPHMPHMRVLRCFLDITVRVSAPLPLDSKWSFRGDPGSTQLTKEKRLPASGLWYTPFKSALNSLLFTIDFQARLHEVQRRHMVVQRCATPFPSQSAAAVATVSCSIAARQAPPRSSGSRPSGQYLFDVEEFFLGPHQHDCVHRRLRIWEEKSLQCTVVVAYLGAVGQSTSA